MNGNTFKPAIQFKNAGLIIRTNNWLETAIFRRKDGSWYWNSDHIARYLDKHIEGDEFKGHPDMWEYDGWLGHHFYI